jgi:hypothetical protein
MEQINQLQSTQLFQTLDAASAPFKPYLSMIPDKPEILIVVAIAIWIGIYILKRIFNMLPLIPPFGSLINFIFGLVLFIWTLFTLLIAAVVWHFHKTS